MRVYALLSFLLLAGIGAACNGDAPAPSGAAGSSAGGGRGGMAGGAGGGGTSGGAGGSSGTAGSTGTGGAGTCSGTPTPCAQLNNTQCQISTGCRLGGCTGTPPACATITAADQCTNVRGCGFDGTRCLGTPMPCSAFGTTMVQCQMQPGCSYSNASGCTGTPGECSLIDPAVCTRQAGCILR